MQTLASGCCDLMKLLDAQAMAHLRMLHSSGTDVTEVSIMLIDADYQPVIG